MSSAFPAVGSQRAAHGSLRDVTGSSSLPRRLATPCRRDLGDNLHANLAFILFVIAEEEVSPISSEGDVTKRACAMPKVAAMPSTQRIAAAREGPQVEVMTHIRSSTAHFAKPATASPVRGPATPENTIGRGR